LETDSGNNTVRNRARDREVEANARLHNHKSVIGPVITRR